MFDTVGLPSLGSAATEAYPSAMPVSAHDVAAVLRERLPDLPVEKLHKLLYYCQGHHLATFGEPLFSEPISAWDMGPVVGRLWRSEKEMEQTPDRQALDEGQLNTVGYVVSRYGRLTGRDLEILSHGEEPWLTVDRERRPHESAQIAPQVMRSFFSRPAGDDESVVLDSAQVTAWLAGAQDRRSSPSRPDDLAELRSRLGDA